MTTVVLQPSPNYDVKEGVEKAFTCDTSSGVGSRPVANIRWYRDVKGQTPITEITTGIATSSSNIDPPGAGLVLTSSQLKLRPSKNDAAIVCKAKNDFNTDWVTRRTLLNVQCEY